MTDFQKEVARLYGNKLRNRVCGICTNENKLLIIKHLGVGENGYLLAPPGGGIEYGTGLKSNLIREFKEETGLNIQVNEFLFVNEYINKPLHTLELFFRVEVIGGKLEKGHDPEMDKEKQIIAEVDFVAFDELKQKDSVTLHDAINKFDTLDDLLNFRGYLTRGEVC